MRIVVDDLSGEQIAGFLREHLHEVAPISPPETQFALDIDGLRRPGVTFWSVVDGETVVGCGAIKRLDADHAELKSMRTDPDRRGTGIASQLLAHIISEAKQMGYTRLSLETGTDDFFRPARSLYERFGFAYCAPFGDYPPSAHNTFMTRVL